MYIYRLSVYSPVLNNSTTTDNYERRVVYIKRQFLESFHLMWIIYVSEILYFMYSLQYLYSSYAGKYLKASQMQNKIRYCQIAKILDLYLDKYYIIYYITVFYTTC